MWIPQSREVNLHDTPIHIINVSGDRCAEVAMMYNDGYNEIILSYANNVKTVDGGTHETGFKNALTRVFNDYGRKYSLLKEADKNLSGDDVREGLTAVVSVNLTDAQFEGQTKSKLGNTEMNQMVSSTLYDGLSAYFEENPSVARTIFGKADASSGSARSQNLGKAHVLENIPAEIASVRKIPLFRTLYLEGDSAGGSAKAGRDRRYHRFSPLGEDAECGKGKAG